MSTSNPNLYLVGFMGAGKTVVGRAVAQKLDLTLIDSDQQIEAKAGMPITQIFATQGEAAFRRMEREFIEQGHPDHGCVVACGGGLIVQPGMLELVRSRGLIICLHASIETLLQRTAANRNRPLLDVADHEARLRALFAEREPIYRSAGTMILTDSRPFHDIVAHVIRSYRRESAERFRNPT